MKLTEALTFFNKLIENTERKSELRILQKFVTIISNLQNRDLSEQQRHSIELQLESLDLAETSNNKKKILNKKFNQFTEYLRKEFSWIVEGYHQSIGMIFGLAFGSGLGVALGTAFEGGTGTAIGLPIGTSLGMVFGMMFGAAKDAKAKKEGRVLS